MISKNWGRFNSLKEGTFYYWKETPLIFGTLKSKDKFPFIKNIIFLQKKKILLCSPLEKYYAGLIGMSKSDEKC
jgi:hypothetical protein